MELQQKYVCLVFLFQSFTDLFGLYWYFGAHKGTQIRYVVELLLEAICFRVTFFSAMLDSAKHGYALCCTAQNQNYALC
jgi:hypothetical protein